MLVPFPYIQHILPFESSNIGLHERVWLVREAGLFIEEEVALSPFHLRLPITVLSYIFGLWLSLARLANKEPEYAGALWDHYGGTPARSLTRLIRSLSLLYFAEHPQVKMAQGYPVTAQKQEKYRAMRHDGSSVRKLLS